MDTIEQNTVIVTHAILRLIADHPAQFGRIRAARNIQGKDLELSAYAIDTDWPLQSVVFVIDAMIDGGLLAQSPLHHTRPLTLTVLGFQTLQNKSLLEAASV